jgi:hypothetical protein
VRRELLRVEPVLVDGDGDFLCRIQF